MANNRFIDFKKFRVLTEMPRFPDNEDITVNISSINRSESLIIFISHHWLRNSPSSEGFTGTKHPDNADNDVFRLCIRGIDQLCSSWAPDSKNCYIWLDYGCLNQNEDPCSEIGDQLGKVIEFCDFLFTPILTSEQYKSTTAMANVFQDFKCDAWNGERGYCKRAWCRLEMFLGSKLTVIKDPVRVNSFKSTLNQQLMVNSRPHVLYLSNQPFPIILPQLTISNLEEMNPKNGLLTNEQDRTKIFNYTDFLTALMDARDTNYSGGFNWFGQRHGLGVYKYANGDVYEGQFKDGYMHGKGLYRFSDGDTYEGDFSDGVMHGKGIFKYSENESYEGDWVGGKKHGQGIYKYASGNSYEGEYREGFMHGIGRFQYARGAVYEGSFRQDKRYGPDMLRGWAQKKGHVNPALKSRFFVLATGAINYYSDLKDKPPFGVDLKGGLFLEGYVVKRAPNTTEPALLLENGTRSNLYMLFSDAASCDKWLEALKAHIDWANNHPGDREAAVPVTEQESSRSSISMLKRLPKFF